MRIVGKNRLQIEGLEIEGLGNRTIPLVAPGGDLALNSDLVARINMLVDHVQDDIDARVVVEGRQVAVDALRNQADRRLGQCDTSVVQIALQHLQDAVEILREFDGELSSDDDIPLLRLALGSTGNITFEGHHDDAAGQSSGDSAKGSEVHQGSLPLSERRPRTARPRQRLQRSERYQVFPPCAPTSDGVAASKAALRKSYAFWVQHTGGSVKPPPANTDSE